MINERINLNKISEWMNEWSYLTIKIDDQPKDIKDEIS